MMTLRFLVHIAKRYLCDNNDRNYNCKHIFAEALIYFEWYCSLLIVQQDTERKAINQEEHQPHNKEMRSTNLVCCPFSLYSLLSKHIPVFFFLLFCQPSWLVKPFFSVWTNIREKTIRDIFQQHELILRLCSAIIIFIYREVSSDNGKTYKS